MAISEQTYEQIALEDGDEQWELVCGKLRARPPMTMRHELIVIRLRDALVPQLAAGDFVVHDNCRLRISTGTFYVPDLAVVPMAHVARLLSERPSRLAIVDEPLPLVVEVWSPSTSGYDVEQKLGEYQKRGDAEIWRLHPHERSLIAWRRLADGAYNEVRITSGHVMPVALPGVSIELAALFT